MIVSLPSFTASACMAHKGFVQIPHQTLSVCPIRSGDVFDGPAHRLLDADQM